MKQFVLIVFSLAHLFVFSQNDVNKNFESIPKGFDDTLKFEIGSCALRLWPYTKERFRIFKTMELDKPNFNLWIGDHVYMLLPKDWSSKSDMIRKYSWQRSEKRLASFLKKVPQYAIWDDHDYGPNNSDSFFYNKKIALEVFKQMWNNPYYGDGFEGVYFSMNHCDALFLMLDGRSFYVKGKQLLGKKQMAWIQKNLKESNANFKFICFNIQVLCDGGYENFAKFKEEYDELLNYIEKEHISGVIFLSGDTHYTEISILKRSYTYSLFDFTFSALTSLTHKSKENKNRLSGSLSHQNNYGLITLMGKGISRFCRIECKNRNGEILWRHDIPASSLK